VRNFTITLTALVLGVADVASAQDVVNLPGLETLKEERPIESRTVLLAGAAIAPHVAIDIEQPSTIACETSRDEEERNTCPGFSVGLSFQRPTWQAGINVSVFGPSLLHGPGGVVFALDQAELEDFFEHRDEER